MHSDEQRTQDNNQHQTVSNASKADDQKLTLSMTKRSKTITKTL